MASATNSAVTARRCVDQPPEVVPVVEWDAGRAVGDVAMTGPPFLPSGLGRRMRRHRWPRILTGSAAYSRVAGFWGVRMAMLPRRVKDPGRASYRQWGITPRPETDAVRVGAFVGIVK